MLQPKRTKYRKWHKDTLAGKATNGTRLTFGKYGLKTMTRARITSRQIEAARQTMARAIKRGGKIWTRIFPHKPFTKKPLEVGMGAGKGAVEFYAAIVKPGHILFEIDGVTAELAKEAFTLAGHKLPIKFKIVENT